MKLRTLAILSLLTLPLFGAAPVIESAVINTATNQLTITGSDFAPGAIAPTVTLNNKALVLVSFTDPTIVATMPNLPAGSYLLRLKNSAEQVASFTVVVQAGAPAIISGYCTASQLGLYNNGYFTIGGSVPYSSSCLNGAQLFPPSEGPNALYGIVIPSNGILQNLTFNANFPAGAGSPQTTVTATAFLLDFQGLGVPGSLSCTLTLPIDDSFPPLTCTSTGSIPVSAADTVVVSMSMEGPAVYMSYGLVSIEKAQ